MSNKITSDYPKWQRHFQIRNFSVERQTSFNKMYTFDDWANHTITIDTEEPEPIMRCLKETAEDEELRNSHPTVRQAWLRYRTLLELVK